MSIFSDILHVGGIVAPIVGSVVPGVGTALGAAVGAGLNGIGSAMDSSESIKQSRDYNQQMWNQTNEYNSPAATAKRLQDAGFNPAFAFQNGAGVGQAQSIPDSTQSLQVNRANAFNDVAGSVANIMMQNKALNADVSLKKSQERVNSANENLLDSSSHLNDVHSTLLRAQSVSEALHQQGEKMRNEILQTTGIPQSLADLDNTISQTANNDANLKLIKANTKLAAANVLKTYAETHNLNVNSANVQLMQPYVINQLRSQTLANWLNNQFQSDALKFSRGLTTNDFPSTFGNRMRLLGYGAQQLQNEGLRNANDNSALRNVYQTKENNWYEWNSLVKAIPSVGFMLK